MLSLVFPFNCVASSGITYTMDKICVVVISEEAHCIIDIVLIIISLVL